MEFEELINNAQVALDKIANHREFSKLVRLNLWDDPAISLCDAKESLEHVLSVYNQYINQPVTRKFVSNVATKENN